MIRVPVVVTCDHCQAGQNHDAPLSPTMGGGLVVSESLPSGWRRMTTAMGRSIDACSDETCRTAQEAEVAGDRTEMARMMDPFATRMVRIEEIETVGPTRILPEG